MNDASLEQATEIVSKRFALPQIVQADTVPLEQIIESYRSLAMQVYVATHDRNIDQCTKALDALQVSYLHAVQAHTSG